MSQTLTRSAAAPHFVDAAMRLIASPIAEIQRRRGIARTVAQLSAMTDQQLEDIGVARGDIREIAERCSR